MNTLELSFLGIQVYKWLRDFSHWKQYFNKLIISHTGTDTTTPARNRDLKLGNIPPNNLGDSGNWTQKPMVPRHLTHWTETLTHNPVFKFFATGAQIVKINSNSNKVSKELRDHIFFRMNFQQYKDLSPRTTVPNHNLKSVGEQWGESLGIFFFFFLSWFAPNGGPTPEPYGSTVGS